jgi:hypothetical protein
MRKLIVCAASALAIAAGITSADAKGCIKGALVGGTAGHFAGHHGFIGAAAGCVIGRHEANKHARAQQIQQNQQNQPYHQRH